MQTQTAMSYYFIDIHYRAGRKEGRKGEKEEEREEGSEGDKTR